MDTRQIARGKCRPALLAFTLIELLTVIAIIAVLAAILFPIFGTVREQARQGNTVSNLHSIYIGARQFYDDEGFFPPSLFGYAEIQDNTTNPPGPRIALPSDDLTQVKPMDQVLNNHNGYLPGYLYREHTKDFQLFTNSDNIVNNKLALTTAKWPLALNVPGDPDVTWQPGAAGVAGACGTTKDIDYPGPSYQGQAKLFYVMDSMDIGPRLDEYGAPVKNAQGAIIYEVHYSPDWTHRLGAQCDTVDGTTATKPIVQQLKYKNPPADRTVITYITQHTATTGSPSVITLLASGTIRKVNYKKAVPNAGEANQLPLNYTP